MGNETTFRAGDRAFVKVGRNLVEVRVEGRAEGGWNVRTRTGRTMLAKTLQTAGGEAISADAANAPAAPKTVKPAAEPSERAVPRKAIGLLSAAAAVLERSDAPMTVRAMIEEAKASGLWTPKGGKTPEQTLYSAIIREIRDKGGESRFAKAGRELFAFK